jgi:hypothetical protein
MNKTPIGPTAHGAIDYGFTALLALAPTLFGLRGRAKAICYGFAANYALTNSLTDHPLGLVRKIPLSLHGKLETPLVPTLLLLPWALGAFKQRNAARFFILFFLAALANFLLTDYDSSEA